ncbi:cyclic nucleotide-binding domain-containing protein [Acaryochloris marina]|uniref:cyclic nucleotide-binding domain-containing protein n=1 Tax=Acaryochloris marina TaxID=155978 RepID=UPI001BAEC9CC|nr:cyclic nucleotide-binding domain-containing protein [Acaryochloris marina]QUY40813.1 cyclic nucleotide-binding domain-containing protein [Acaryochloris marina S15]
MVNLAELPSGSSPWKLGRLAQLLLLAMVVLTYSVIEMAVANSLFLTHVGADGLPLAFILIGLFSIPAYALFSQVVDQYSRPQLFRYMLMLAAVMAVGMWFLLAETGLVTYYIVLILVFFQWDFHNNILYASLLTDYFSALDYKRYAPFIGMAQAAGTLIGGGLTALLSHFFSTRELLLGLPVVFGIAIAQLFFLENTQRQIETVGKTDNVGMIEALKTFPDLVKRYPLMLFLAASSFLLVIIYLSAEFLWFSIYADNFTEDALTGFLGLMRVSVSVIQVLVLYCFTRPLLHWVGVARMNVVYPLTTLFGLFGIVLQTSLPAAIALHINGDGLYKSINIPVHQLNYNAVPREFLGRIRTLSDGFFYAVGLTTAGCLLWICHHTLSLAQISWIAIGLTCVLFGLRLPMGKYYAQGLEEMIRSDTINLDELGNVQAQFPAESNAVIRDLLKDSDRYTQIKGLEFATQLGQPSQFYLDVQPLLGQDDPDLQTAIVRLFSTNPDPETVAIFEDCLQTASGPLRSTALEILIANRYPFTAEQLQPLLTEADPTIRPLAAVAVDQVGQMDETLQATCDQIWYSDLSEAAGQAVVRVIACSQDRSLMPLLTKLLIQGDPGIQQESLAILATLGQAGDRDLADIAITALDHPAPLVRAAAFKLLGVVHVPDYATHIALGFEDPDSRVRQQAAKILPAYGKPGLLMAQESLSANDTDVVNTAIAAIGQVRNRQAGKILYEHLAPEFQQLVHTRKWQQQIPSTDPNWQPLALAIEDFHNRLLQKVLYILACLGHDRTVNAINRILSTNEQKDLASAVEALASLKNRRFVLPLLPVLEQVVKKEPVSGRSCVEPQWMRDKGYKLLLEALETQDRWIRIGALIALAGVPSALVNDPDPLVKTVAEQIFLSVDPDPLPTNQFMKRLLLLKEVALFKNLSLDELLLIDQTLEQEQKLAGETIFSEGSWCTYFYIIAEGKVQIIKDIDDQSRDLKQLSVGEYFGEVALFDDAPHWDGAIALENCTLLKLEKNRFISLMTQRPHIILEICRFLSQRLRETDNYRSLGTLESSQLSEVQS